MTVDHHRLTIAIVKRTMWKSQCLRSSLADSCWSIIWSWRSICCSVASLRQSSYIQQEYTASTMSTS